MECEDGLNQNEREGVMAGKKGKKRERKSPESRTKPQKQRQPKGFKTSPQKGKFTLRKTGNR